MALSKLPNFKQKLFCHIGSVAYKHGNGYIHGKQSRMISTTTRLLTGQVQDRGPGAERKRVPGVRHTHVQAEERSERVNTGLVGLATGVAALIGVIGAGWYLSPAQEAHCLEALPEVHQPAITAGNIVPELPYYRSEDIKAHASEETGMWVTFGDGVYDVTEFVASHPGGEKILLAVGGGLEPFWNMYAVHKNQAVYSVLEEMRIGNVDPADKKKMPVDLRDPYATDPDRHPAMRINSLKPYDAETPPELITEHFYTPNNLFYVRNHLPVPQVDVDKYRLEISHDSDPHAVKLSLEDLKTKFKVHTETVTLQCAGNRRHHMHAVKRLKLKGTSGMTAISNATWTGVKLVDVLTHCGIKEEEYSHVIFEGLDKDISGTAYEASIPIETAMDPRKDVMLAFGMNGEDLPPDHGYPLRLVVPGTVGARQVKWVHKIKVSKDESQGHWQQKDYKTFHPSTDWHNADFSQAPALQDYPIQSAICEPKEDAILTDSEEVTVKGYAWSGGGRGIIRVDVSADGGATWRQAQLHGISQKLHRQWAWRLFEVTVPLPRGQQVTELVCKAVDSSQNQQPDDGKGIWNMLGLIHNAWHRIEVHIPAYEGEEEEDEE